MVAWAVAKTREDDAAYVAAAAEQRRAARQAANDAIARDLMDVLLAAVPYQGPPCACWRETERDDCEEHSSD